MMILLHATDLSHTLYYGSYVCFLLRNPKIHIKGNLRKILFFLLSYIHCEKNEHKIDIFVFSTMYSNSFNTYQLHICYVLGTKPECWYTNMKKKTDVLFSFLKLVIH